MSADDGLESQPRAPNTEVVGADRGVAVRARRSRDRLIRLTSRAGVWGFVAALVPALADALGRPLAPGLVGPVSSAGLIVSGLGTLAASVLVGRSLPSGFSALKLACVFGAPFGAILVLGGLALMRPLGAFADRVDALGPVVLGLAILVVGLLFVGFSRGHRGSDPDGH